MERDGSLLDDYVLSLTDAARPRVCFLPTASGDADHYVVRFYRRFSPRPARPATSRCSAATRAPAASRTTSPAHLLSQDLIYVGGGNVREHARRLARARARRASCAGRGARASCCAGPRPARCAGSTQALSAFHGAPRQRARARAAAVLQLRALRRRAGAPRRVPPLRRRRHARRASPPRTASRCTSAARAWSASSARARRLRVPRRAHRRRRARDALEVDLTLALAEPRRPRSARRARPARACARRRRAASRRALPARRAGPA